MVGGVREIGGGFTDGRFVWENAQIRARWPGVGASSIIRFDVVLTMCHTYRRFHIVTDIPNSYLRPVIMTYTANFTSNNNYQHNNNGGTPP